MHTDTKVYCPVCNSNDTSVKAPYRYHNKVFANKNLIACNSCEMYFASPMPLESDLSEFNASYFDSAHGGQSSDPGSTAFFSALAKLRGTFLSEYVNANKVSIKKVLEIGPGPGYFAEQWLSVNSDVKYYAIETDKSCYDSLQSKGVTILDDQEYRKLDVQFDMVVISHVLEHVTDPYGFLEFATGHLRENGVLFIDVPCSDWMHKSFDEPHLLFFTKKPMAHLLNNLGFEKVELKYFGQTIKELCSKSFLKKKIESLRVRLIKMGFAPLFSAGNGVGMSSLNPLERAIIKPFKANIESAEQAWWLRALATKKIS